LYNLHVFCDVGEDGRLDEVTLITDSLATGFDGSACLLTLFDIAIILLESCSIRAIEVLPHDPIKLELGDLRTLEGLLIEGIANSVLGCSSLELFNKFVVNALLDVNT